MKNIISICIAILFFMPIVQAQVRKNIKKNAFYEHVEIEIHIDSCINPFEKNIVYYKIKNFSSKNIYINPVSLTYYLILFDSHGKSVKRKSIIEEEKEEPKILSVKSNDSILYCDTTTFFEQFEFKKEETYYYLPIYYNQYRKKKGKTYLSGMRYINPLVFHICKCK